MSTDSPENDRPLGAPRRPEQAASRSRGSLAPVLTVLGSLAALALVVVGCAGFPGLLVLGVLGAAVGFVGLQYLIWGWWLGNQIRKDGERELERPND